MANFTDKQKLKNVVKKGVSAVLAAALVANLWAVLSKHGKKANSTMFAYTNDSSPENVTRIMMDGNNMLKYGYFMNTVRTTNSDNVTYNVKLKFKIPGYDPNNLKFFIFNKNQNMFDKVQEYTLQSGLQDPTPSIYLKNFKASSYEVHVYNGSLNENNFVCKSEIALFPENNWQSSILVDLKDATGQPIMNDGAPGNKFQMRYVTPVSLNTSQFFIGLPTQFASGKQLIPFWTSTVKVAFFATNRENNASPNMDKCLYEYVYKGKLGSDGTGQPIMTGENLMFAPDAQYGLGSTGSPVTYEAHFYANEVKEGNFICKATDLIIPAGNSTQNANPGGGQEPPAQDPPSAGTESINSGDVNPDLDPVVEQGTAQEPPSTAPIVVPGGGQNQPAQDSTSTDSTEEPGSGNGGSGSAYQGSWSPNDSEDAV